MAMDFHKNYTLKIYVLERNWEQRWPCGLYFHVQEAFFGKDLLDKSKQSRQQGVESGLLEEGQNQVERKYQTTSFLDSSSDPLLSASTTSLPSRHAARRTYISRTKTRWFSDEDGLNIRSDPIVKKGLILTLERSNIMSYHFVGHINALYTCVWNSSYRNKLE